MTYNIKNGGQRGGDASRLDAVIEVIADYSPDVLALQELRNFDGREHLLLHRLENGTGLRGFLAHRRLSGQPVAVLVRRGARVLASQPISGAFHHGAVQVCLPTDRGALAVISTHLNPWSGRRRWREARRLLAGTSRLPLVLLMGDLNTLDPWSDHTERLAALPRRYRSRHLLRGPRRQADTRAVAHLCAAGFVDVFRSVGESDEPGAKRYTAPTELGGDEFGRMRLDYVLATPPLAALASGCRVLDGGVRESASDHYPVVAEFDLTLG